VPLRATCVILALIANSESSVSLTGVHGTVSPLRNRFISAIGSRTLGFGRRRNGQFFLATAGLFVYIYFGSRHAVTAGVKGVKRTHITKVYLSNLYFSGLVIVLSPCKF